MRTVSLDTEFFSNHKVVELEQMEHGVKMVITWLKLLCFAGKTDDDGRIYQTKGEVLTRPFLSDLLGITEDEVGQYLKTFMKMRMIRFDPDKTMRLTNWSKWQLNGNKECEKSREKDSEKESSPTPPYKEKDTEKEGRKEQEKKENPPSSTESQSFSKSVREIIDHLNLICSTHYKYDTPKTQVCIKARLKEGFSIDDFKKVIESKHQEWKGTEFERYLKPDTLFSNKFEGYLNYAERETNQSFYEEEFIQAALNRKD